jgi:hypothetical protein
VGDSAKQGDQVCVAIRPEAFSVDLSAPPAVGAEGGGTERPTAHETNVIVATIVVVGLSDGGVLEARVNLTDLPNTEWIIRWPSTTGQRPEPGTVVTLRAGADDCLLVLDPETPAADDPDAIEADAEHGMHPQGNAASPDRMAVVGSEPAPRA